uniref:Uncharacterized protein n=1 Tax=Romanomermis culicivorax TaxID=13658 RepID=A0A915HL51_ROMCU
MQVLHLKRESILQNCWTPVLWTLFDFCTLRKRAPTLFGPICAIVERKILD